jgi:hypothetical protein
METMLEIFIKDRGENEEGNTDLLHARLAKLLKYLLSGCRAWVGVIRIYTAANDPTQVTKNCWPITTLGYTAFTQNT